MTQSSDQVHKGSAGFIELTAAAKHWAYTPAPHALSGRNILITGAGDGIGAVAAKTFASFGANVLLLGRTRQKLETVFDWIEAHTSTQAVIVPCDLEQLTPESVMTLHDAIADGYGTLDGILHNASMLGPRVPLAHYPPQEWLRVMQINVNAPFLLTQGLYDLLDRSADACVINTTSGVSRQGRAYWGAYAVSKHAAEGFNEVLADETEHAGRIRVYSVNPGGTRTAMRAAAYPQEDPATLPRAEDHMALYVFLMEGAKPGKPLPPTGAQIQARGWRPTDPATD